MLWLRNEDLSQLCGLRVGLAFMIDDLIYVIGPEETTDPWLMYSIDPYTLAITRVPVICHDFQLDERDINSDHFAVYNGVAYKYFDEKKEIAAGTVESDGFHWRIVQTSGPKPKETMYISTGAIFADSARYVMLAIDYDGVPEHPNQDTFKYELDLETMHWSRIPTRCAQGHSQERDLLYTQGLHIFATPSKLHVFWSEFPIKGHMVVDRASGQCTFVSYDDKYNNPVSGTIFAALNHIYSLVRTKAEEQDRQRRNLANYVLILYQFNEVTSQWTKIGQCPATTASMSLEQSKVVVNGSRVFIFGSETPLFGACARALEYLMVFELNPSLFDCALASLMWRSNDEKQRAAAILPSKLARQLIRDTSNDHLVPIQTPENADLEEYYRSIYKSEDN